MRRGILEEKQGGKTTTRLDIAMIAKVMLQVPPFPPIRSGGEPRRRLASALMREETSWIGR
jgi:hypothetical protein